MTALIPTRASPRPLGGGIAPARGGGRGLAVPKGARPEWRGRCGPFIASGCLIPGPGSRPGRGALT